MVRVLEMIIDHDLVLILNTLVDIIEPILDRLGITDVKIRLDLLPGDVDKGLCFFYSEFSRTATSKDKTYTLHIIMRNLTDNPLDQYIISDEIDTDLLDNQNLPVNLSLQSSFHGADELGRMTSMLTYEFKLGAC